jgi:hypothetical protein
VELDRAIGGGEQQLGAIFSQLTGDNALARALRSPLLLYLLIPTGRSN